MMSPLSSVMINDGTSVTNKVSIQVCRVMEYYEIYVRVQFMFVNVLLVTDE